MNILEAECSLLCLLEISINVNIVVYIHYCCFCILFTFILVVLFVDFCILIYHFFMLVFVVILSSTIICKQVCLLNCVVFVALVYNFNVKPCQSKKHQRIWIFHFRNYAYIIGHFNPSVQITTYLRVFARNLRRGNRQKNIFLYFVQLDKSDYVGTTFGIVQQ